MIERDSTLRGTFSVATMRCLAFGLVSGVVGLSATGCGTTFFNQTASLGGETAGRRGNVQVLFINNTPHRAVFTYGTFDQTDQFAEPHFEQFEPGEFDRTLEGDSQSGIRTLTCGRVFSIGSEALQDAMRLNLPEDDYSDEALVDGAEFLDIDDDTDSEPSPAGAAPAFEALLGVDFACGSLLILRLEFNDAGPSAFRIDFEVVPSSSER